MSDTPFLHLDSIRFPVTTLGPGRRIGLWVEGCSLRCPGCMTPQLFERDPRHRVPVSDVVRALAPILPLADGLTVSGGEPFEQAEPLGLLLERVREGGRGDVIVYSGYTLAEIRLLGPSAARLLAVVDVLVDGRFRSDLPSADPWQGSSNQRRLLLSARARALASNDTRPAAGRTLDVHYSKTLGLRVTGIPARPFQRELRARLRARGIELANERRHPC